MCRFVLYRGRPIALAALLTEPENSLIHQSYASREREEPLNGDGFGVVWYVPTVGPDAALLRMITPAWSNQNLRHLARVTRSGTVLAHVRAASENLPVTETNTHPFVWGRYAFMHNGEIGGFSAIKRALLDQLGPEAYGMIEGTTDSEHLFGLVVDRLVRGAEGAPQEVLAQALAGAIADVLGLVRGAGVEEVSTLNVALSDGECAVVCRFSDGEDDDAPSLHLHTGKHYHCESGVPRLEAVEIGEHAVIVSSEALTDDPDWAVVPPNHLVVISGARDVEVRPLPAVGRADR
jgi:predicted glutamine amidotransferase